MAQALELHRRELGEVREPVDRHAPGAPLEAGGERLGEQLGAGGVGDAAGVDEGTGAAGAPADEQRRRFVALEDGGELGDEGGIGGDRTGRGHGGGGVTAVGPAHVGRQDQRGHLTGRADRRGDRVGGVAGDGLGAVGGADPARHVARDGLDVALELGVVLLVVGGVVADDVHDRREGLAGVVQVGEGVAEARARGAAGWPRAARRSARSRRPRRWPRPRRARAPRASPARRRARPRSASPRCPGS